MTHIVYIGAARAFKNIEGEAIWMRDVTVAHPHFLKAYAIAQFPTPMHGAIVELVRELVAPFGEANLALQIKDAHRDQFESILKQHNVPGDVVLLNVNGSTTLVAARLLDETTLDFGTWCHLFKGHVEIARDYLALNDSSRTRVTMHVRSSMFSGVGENQQGAWLAAVDAMKRGETWKP